VKTLVIRNVDGLSLEHQAALSAWLERPAMGRTQVVSTTNAPLFPRVAAGLFLEKLYYRLNTLVLGAPTG
jgi:transcriptional regulator of acetoin/glycerol metabolism